MPERGRVVECHKRAVVQDGDAIGDTGESSQVMVHDHHTDPVVGECPQQLQHGLLCGAVESQCEFVDQQQVRPPEQRLRDGELSLLAAGQQSRARVEPPLDGGDEREDVIENAGERSVAAMGKVAADAKVLPDRHVGEDRPGTTDERHSGGAPLVRSQRADVLAGHIDPGSRRRCQTGDHAEQRGLPGAVGTDQRHDLVPFVRPEVFRVRHIERDLAYYWGPGWRDRVDLLPETRFYVERINDVAATDPIPWIAHSYTRYLADLSGGLIIDKAITEAYGLEQDGRWLYTFDLPEGIDPRTWKNAYRQLLNVLDIDASTAIRLIEEALVAYQCNIALNDALVDRHGTIHLDIEVA